MIKLIRIFASILFVVLSVVSITASATNYSLWIKGKGGSGTAGNYNDFSNWGPSSVNAGVNKKAVNWDGYNSISSQNYLIRNALDCFCTGSNWCYIATHSAGDLMMGYTLANYGGSTRYKKNAVANSSGVCGNSDGTTQVGWNIKWVRAASGAAGGSELANSGTWVVSDPIVKDLVTTTARAMYNHNNTRNIWFYMYAAAKGTLYSGILPGQDDEAVAYHSTGGVSGSAGGAFCNPSDWLCNDLTLGSGPTEGGFAKWSYHSVAFRDDNEQYNHYQNGNWENIVGVVRAAMATYAQ
jgi:hypothetical protein